MKKYNFFWVGLSDLMISMFFVMLIITAVFIVANKDALFNVSKLGKENTELKNRLADYQRDNKILAKKVKLFEDEVVVLKNEKVVLETVQRNVEKLKERKDLFVYDNEFKRYTLKFDVQFKHDKRSISQDGLEDWGATRDKLKDCGVQLKEIVDQLADLKKQDDMYEHISYIIVIAGSASLKGDPDYNYRLSYERAYNLYKFWRDEQQIDFDSQAYHHLIEFQIAGNGTGGIGRIPIERGKTFNIKNQRFIINILPKIGEV